MRIEKIVSGILILLIFLSVMLVTENVAVAQGGPTNSDAPIFSETALTLTAKHYSEDFGVSMEESIQRLVKGNDIRELQSRLKSEFPAVFAGLWVQHSPRYRIIVLLSNSKYNYLIHDLIPKSLKNDVEFQQAGVPLEKLELALTAIIPILQDMNDIVAGYEINIVENQIEIYTANQGRLRELLQSYDVVPNEYIKIIETQQSTLPVEDIYGGLALTPCTSGFSVLHDDQGIGVLGITTAGHCACNNPPTCTNTSEVYYNGTLLPLEGVVWDDAISYDIEWHTAPGYTPRNLFFDGTYNVYVYGFRHKNDQYVGEYVCKYGKTTGSGCGTITSTNYLGNYVRVHNDNEDLAEGGDSGGPWYRGNIAYGIMTAEIEPGNDAVYMAANYFDILDLCILRDIANPTAPILNSALQNNALTLTWIHGDDVCGYEIHRDQSPYFSISETTLISRITDDSFTSSEGIGDPNNNYYYQIRAITGSQSQSSNIVGEFDFVLVPGS